ncbi:hypothetical protein ACFQX6_65015 [Streptosporangium lutulentum]
MLSRFRAGWAPGSSSGAPRTPLRVLQVCGALSALVLIFLLFMGDIAPIFLVPTLLVFVGCVGFSPPGIRWSSR